MMIVRIWSLIGCLCALVGVILAIDLGHYLASWIMVILVWLLIITNIADEILEG